MWWTGIYVQHNQHNIVHRQHNENLVTESLQAWYQETAPWETYHHFWAYMRLQQRAVKRLKEKTMFFSWIARFLTDSTDFLLYSLFECALSISVSLAVSANAPECDTPMPGPTAAWSIFMYSMIQFIDGGTMQGTLLLSFMSA